MRVTVDLTDEQAETWVKGWRDLQPANNYQVAAMAVRDAIIAARPKPLKVGDIVRYMRGPSAVVIALGTHSGIHWMVVNDVDDGPTFTTTPLNKDYWTLDMGSPIVWPE